MERWSTLLHKNGKMSFQSLLKVKRVKQERAQFDNTWEIIWLVLTVCLIQAEDSIPGATEASFVVSVSEGSRLK
jgi:hypothetical protein